MSSHQFTSTFALNPLTLRQTRNIFQLSSASVVSAKRSAKTSRLLKMSPLVFSDDEVLRFAEEHYNTNAAGRWNGRQIRNAVRSGGGPCSLRGDAGIAAAAECRAS